MTLSYSELNPTPIPRLSENVLPTQLVTSTEGGLNAQLTSNMHKGGKKSNKNIKTNKHKKSSKSRKNSKKMNKTRNAKKCK